MLGWFGIWHAGRWCKASENRGECLTWLFESIAKQGCEDANYLCDPDLNKEHEELRAFINKELVMVPDRGKHEMHPVWVGQFFVTKLLKLDTSRLGCNENKVLIYSNRKTALASIHRCEKFHAYSWTNIIWSSVWLILCDHPNELENSTSYIDKYMVCRLRERFSVANIFSRAFNTSAVEQNLDLNYIPACSFSDHKSYLIFFGHDVDSELGSNSGVGL